MHEAGPPAVVVAEALAAGGPSGDTGSGTPGARSVAVIVVAWAPG